MYNRVTRIVSRKLTILFNKPELSCFYDIHPLLHMFVWKLLESGEMKNSQSEECLSVCPLHTPLGGSECDVVAKLSDNIDIVF